MLTLPILSITISVLIVALTWFFSRNFFFRLFTAMLHMFTEYVTLLQRATTGSQVLSSFAQFVLQFFNEDAKIVIWYSFNKKSMPLVTYNVPKNLLSSKKIHEEFARISANMLVNSETIINKDIFLETIKKIPKLHRVFSYPFVHKGTLFGVVHLLLPRRHVGVQRRTLAHIYASIARTRFTQLSAERDTLKIASDIGAIERSFEALIDVAPIGMIICETDLSVRYMNETAGQLLETTPATQSGMQLLNNFSDSNQKKKITNLVKKILQKGSIQEQESKFNFISKSNTQRYLDLHVYPIRSASGKVLEIVFVLRDGTKRYLLEEELALTQKEYQTELEDKVRIATRELVVANKELTRLNAIKSEFVSTISHELRTPLTSIIGYLSLLESKKLGTLNSKQFESVQILISEARRLASLINDILDLSRLESGKSSLELTYFSVDDLIRKVIQIMKPLIDKKGQTLTFEHPHPVHIQGDTAKIQQVLTNIVSNAIKFTQNGKKIQLRLLKDSKSCIISVQDQGLGIAQKDVAHIFESFHRGDVATKHAIKGTGLGLTIVKHIVDLHSGKIKVQSHVGRGTRVTILLPLKQK